MMTEQEQAIFNQLSQYAEYFERDSIINTPIRWLVWGLIRFLVWAVKNIQQTVLEVLDLSKLLESPSVQGTINTFSGVAFLIGTVSLIVYAMRRILNPEAGSKAFLENLALGIATTAFSGVLISMLLTTSTQIAKTLYTDNKYTATAHSIINANTVDVYQLVLNGFDVEKAHTKLTVKTSPFFDYAEVVEPINTEMAWDAAGVDDHNSLHEFNERWGNTPSSAPAIFGKYIHLDPQTGEPKLVDIGINLWLGINRYYYRYKMNSFYIVMYLMTTLAVYVLSSFKFVKLFFEIIYNQTILPFFAFSDLNNATTLKRVLNNIKNAFMMFVLTPLVLVTYTHVQNYLAGQSYTGFTSIIIQLALALAVIDGPNIVQEITGYDAGLRSTTQGIVGAGIGAYHGLRSGVGVLKGAGNAVKGAGNLAKSAADKTGLSSKVGEAVQSGKDWISGEVKSQQTQPTNANERSAYIQEALAKKTQYEQPAHNDSPSEPTKPTKPENNLKPSGEGGAGGDIGTNEHPSTQPSHAQQQTQPEQPRYPITSQDSAPRDAEKSDAPSQPLTPPRSTASQPTASEHTTREINNNRPNSEVSQAQPLKPTQKQEHDSKDEITPLKTENK
ncbi:hypothetical protein NHG29_03110 [Aerococcaceae bacterium NML160702]|nr:hypothetical protein [Aerococcaceae bacterium NML160702]